MATSVIIFSTKAVMFYLAFVCKTR